MAWFCAFLEIPSGSFRPCYHGAIENNKGELYPDQIRTVDDQGQRVLEANNTKMNELFWCCFAPGVGYLAVY